MTSGNGSPTSPSPNDQPTQPLSSRTQQRLGRMETWSRRHLSSSPTCDERLMAMEARVHATGQYLIALLKEWEENLPHQ